MERGLPFVGGPHTNAKLNGGVSRPIERPVRRGVKKMAANFNLDDRIKAAINTVAVDSLVSRLRLRPEDIGGPSRMDMLREREEAANEIERQAEVIRELQSALMDAGEARCSAECAACEC